MENHDPFKLVRDIETIKLFEIKTLPFIILKFFYFFVDNAILNQSKYAAAAFISKGILNKSQKLKLNDFSMRKTFNHHHSSIVG